MDVGATRAEKKDPRPRDERDDARRRRVVFLITFMDVAGERTITSGSTSTNARKTEGSADGPQDPNDEADSW